MLTLCANIGLLIHEGLTAVAQRMSATVATVSSGAHHSHTHIRAIYWRACRAFRCFLPNHNNKTLSGPIPAVQSHPKSQGGLVVALTVVGFSGATAKKGALGQIIVQKLEKICNEGTQQGNMTAALQGK